MQKKIARSTIFSYLARVLVWLLWGCEGTNVLVHSAVPGTDKARNCWHLPRSHTMD